MTLVIAILAGFVFLIFGAELLVRGASRLATVVGISPLVVGLTVVAYGTSAPELAVSVQSAYAGAADIALGNVVGSNIANILLILGVSALIIPLSVAQQLIRLDVPVMIGLSVLVWLMAFDGVIGRLDGLVLVAGGLTYTIFAIWQSRKESKAVQQEFEQQFGAKTSSKYQHLLLQMGFVIAGLVLLVMGANWPVDGAVAIATLLGVSKLVIGLTIVAVGTSLPEAATSIVAAIRGERDIAVAVACLPVFFTGKLISRWEGLLFLGYYAVYIGYLLIQATQNQPLNTAGIIITGLILPFTILLLVIPGLQTVIISRRTRLIQ